MKRITGILLALITAVTVFGCSKSPAKSGSSEKAETTDINVYVLNGPTGIGAVNMWADAENGNGKQNYHFYSETAPDAIVSKISTGEADIAAIATNLAAKLYKKTGGGIRMLAVNTLGVLSVLDNGGAEMTSLSELKGRKIVTTGQGANPEYVIRYLLKANGVDPDSDVAIEFVADGSELPAVWAKPENADAVIIAPQPVATAITLKYDTAKTLFDLSDEWNKAGTDSRLMMGCLVVRTAFLEEHPQAVEDFMEDYSASVRKAVEDRTGTGEKCEKYGIAANAKIAEKAIDGCNLCVVTGAYMRKNIEGYYNMLFEADPGSVGAVPDGEFYAGTADGEWYAD